jgi:hypothetical protein
MLFYVAVSGSPGLGVRHTHQTRLDVRLLTQSRQFNDDLARATVAEHRAAFKRRLNTLHHG